MKKFPIPVIASVSRLQYSAAIPLHLVAHCLSLYTLLSLVTHVTWQNCSSLIGQTVPCSKIRALIFVNYTNTPIFPKNYRIVRIMAVITWTRLRQIRFNKEPIYFYVQIFYLSRFATCDVCHVWDVWRLWFVKCVMRNVLSFKRSMTPVGMGSAKLPRKQKMDK